MPVGDLTSVLQIDYLDDEASYADEAEDPSEVRSGVPVGLAFSLTTTDNASSTNGELRVVLGHYDERPKSASESVDDVPERDVDVTFQVSIP